MDLMNCVEKIQADSDSRNDNDHKKEINGTKSRNTVSVALRQQNRQRLVLNKDIGTNNA